MQQGVADAAAWRPLEEQAHGHGRENARKVFPISVVISLVGTISGKSLKCCHQMSYFKAKMHQIRFRLGQCSPDTLVGFKGAYF